MLIVDGDVVTANRQTSYSRKYDIVTEDESWIHHFDPEEKRLSMQYRHTSSPRPKIFKRVPSAGKIF